MAPIKIAIYGKTPESKAQLQKEIQKSGFILDENKPEIVISYGGDGTFLWAERKYPGIPKALFRYSNVCKKCHNLPITHALQLIKKGKYKLIAHKKLRAKIDKTVLLATNDIVVRNSLPTHAIRFTIKINGKESKEHIGDGIVIATTFGSTGYFHSITRKKFNKGIGIAFNNTTIEQKPIFLPENARVEFTLTRGEAFVVADNEPRMILLTPGKSITIMTSSKKAKLISF
jgi:NAD+ kinase